MNRFAVCSIVVLGWLTGCSDGGASTPGTDADGGVVGDGAVGGDAAPIVDALVLDDFLGRLGKGTGQIAGRIRFSAAGTHAVTLRLFAEKYSTKKTVRVVGGEVAYRVTGLVDGTYTLGALVDVDGDDRIEAGDLGGFLGGTTTKPVLVRSAARTVTVVGGATVNEDLAVGPLVCAGRIGAACSRDEDCRIHHCTCPSSSDAGVPLLYSQYLLCGPAKTCATPEGGCAVVCQPSAPLAEEDGSCLRDLER